MSNKPWEVMQINDYDTYKKNKQISETIGDNDGNLNKSNQNLRDKYGITSDDYSYSDLQKQSAYSSNPYDTAAKNNLNNANKYLHYSNPYAKEVYNTYEKLKNFKYNPDTDEEYKAYKDMYTRQGMSAQDRTYSKLSALSGGRNNSWASAAVAQIANQYNQKTADAIPVLAQKAYNKLLSQHNIAKDLSERETQKNQKLYDSQMKQYESNLKNAQQYRENEQDLIKHEQDLKEYQHKLDNDEISNRYKESQISKNEQSILKTKQEIEKSNIELKYLTELEQIKLQLGYLDIEEAEAITAYRKAQTAKTYATMYK